jgi:iron complex outermembrane receptor protein
VINVILKDEYEGFRMKARYGSRSRDAGEETGISLLTGASTERGSFVAGFEHDSRDPISMRIANSQRRARTTPTVTA